MECGGGRGFAFGVQQVDLRLQTDADLVPDAGQGLVLIAQGQVTRVVVRREPFLARSAPSLLIREALPEELPAVGELRVQAYVAGSAHPNGFSVGFADGSVRMLEYGIDLEAEVVALLGDQGPEALPNQRDALLPTELGGDDIRVVHRAR